MTTLDDDLQYLETTQAERDRYKAQVTELKATLRRDRVQLALRVARPVLIVAASLVFVAFVITFIYAHAGGGPTARAAEDAAQEQARYTRSFEANCPRAGGREIGQNGDRVCEFAEGTLRKYASTNSADRIRWTFACEAVGGKVTGTEADSRQYCSFPTGAVLPVRSP